MQFNLEQKKIIEMKPNGHMLVKGVAGSGKTTVAIYRIPFLLDHYCPDKDDKILLITYNKTLQNYIKYLYNKVENYDNQVSIFSVEDTSEKVTIRTIDSIMFKYFKKNNKFNYKIVSDNISRNILKKAIFILTNKFKEVKILDPKNTNFLKDEIEWMNACSIFELEEYQNTDRVGRASKISKQFPQKLLKNSLTRQAIYELKYMYEDMMKKEKHIDYKMMNNIALNSSIPDIEKYTHILIDESQDLTRVQLEVIKNLYNNKSYSSLCFISDNAQSIYPHAWLGKGRTYSSVGYDMSGKSRVLSKNYRTTTQIAQAAYSLLESDSTLLNDAHFVKPSLIDRKGEFPVYKYFKTIKEEIEFVSSQIKKMDGLYKNSEICIIGKQKILLDEAESILKQKEIKCNFLNKQNPDFESNTVKLTTMHSIKGLEFKVIFIIGINQGIIPFTEGVYNDENDIIEASERRLLYVGMTRANELLYMSSHNKKSKFISEINSDYLLFDKNLNMRSLKNINITDYVMTDKIVDLYSKEEKIRQWVLTNLINKYKYPTSLIDLEYEVMQFSKKGYVDISISIYNKGKKTPYIFFEIKSYKSGIIEAKKQLLSYMQTTYTVRYAVVTDGYDFIVLDRNGDELEDIPLFNVSMLPDTIEHYEYTNTRRMQKFNYSRDINEINSLNIKNTFSDGEMEIEEVIEIGVYGDVVAGMPKYILEDISNKFILPKEWLVPEKQHFILKVSGDSMINAGIDIDDYVVISSQNYANQGEIVVATIDEDSTLKKYMLMGGSVLLIPENSEYEPINLKPEEVNINGIVIGVLKKKN